MSLQDQMQDPIDIMNIYRTFGLSHAIQAFVPIPRLVLPKANPSTQLEYASDLSMALLLFLEHVKSWL